MSFKLLSWNVRGLGNDETMNAVRNVIVEQQPIVIMLQETKISNLEDNDLRDLWRMPWQFLQLPSIGLSGGIVLAWNSNYVEVIDKVEGAFSVTVTCMLRENGFAWMVGCCV
ncbi:hypothetical protein FRX31_002555 [Thalictrum thalictroides]|uniref:Endonuclease/exonuclease/phosphatase domain-containing protein n=1 Tax=Thalictrum thalictroides TaxID=46969 RepID=A0A7J6XFZ1_THATH|nr:hypothetical protein FRX31_002555 [Thalictrum thalictroides]